MITLVIVILMIIVFEIHIGAACCDAAVLFPSKMLDDDQHAEINLQAAMQMRTKWGARAESDGCRRGSAASRGGFTGTSRRSFLRIVNGKPTDID
jgi:hypothetical protein